MSGLRGLYERAIAPGRPPRVVFCGSQGWADRDRVRARIAVLRSESVVLHGGAAGADRMAGYYAQDRGDLYEMNARPLWAYLGRSAGHARNAVLLSLLDPEHDWVEAFWDGQSPGTRGVIDAARRMGMPMNVHHADGTQRTSSGLQKGAS